MERPRHHPVPVTSDFPAHHLHLGNMSFPTPTGPINIKFEPLAQPFNPYGNNHNHEDRGQQGQVTPGTSSTSIPEPTIKCGKCSETFHTQNDLKRHKVQSPGCRKLVGSHKKKAGSAPVIPGGSGHLPCSVCGHRFSKSDKLKRHHKAVHLQEKEAKCDLCGTQFSRKEHLRRHLRNVHHQS